MQQQETGETEQGEGAKPEVFDPAIARDLLRGMMAVGGSKLQEAEFVKFVEALAEGELRLENGKLLSNEGEAVEWDEVLASREALKVPRGPTELEGPLDGSPEATSDFETNFRELERTWKKAHENGEIDAEELGLFQSIFNSKDMSRILEQHPKTMDDFFDAGVDGAQGLTEEAAPPRSSLKPNPYTDASENGLVVAEKLLAAGRLQEAIVALEAAVDRNPNSSEGWRLLGECHADNEQDIEAIHCLKKGHGVDPYNLDSLMALGVSLTNELDVPQALLYLRTWLGNHDDFQDLPGLSDRPPEDFNELKMEVIRLFQAALQRPHGFESRLHSALGVVYNIDRDYDKALFHLAQALQFAKEASAPSLWNKIGATLANSGRSAAALLAYRQTLRLRPNYPRAWTNLGVAKANLGEMEEALQHYLVALELNPDASHLWYYVRSALIGLNRYSWISLAENRDFKALRQVVPRGETPPLSELVAPGDPLAPADTPKVLQEIFKLLNPKP